MGKCLCKGLWGKEVLGKGFIERTVRYGFMENGSWKGLVKRVRGKCFMGRTVEKGSWNGL